MGYIHSVETMGAVDGPGLRYVVFMQGCPFRCLFCHNPDTWQVLSSHRQSVDTVLADILKYRDFFRFSGGGVTLSGGEPLMQPEFVRALVGELRKAGIHVAIDTCGYVDLNEDIQDIVAQANLFLLDIKHLDNTIHQQLTGKPNDKTLAFLDFLRQKKKHTWIRIVLLPGYNMDDAYTARLIDFLHPYENVDKIELLPYHDKGKIKWQELGLTYQLEHIMPPTQAAVEPIVNRLRQAGYDVLVNM